MTCAPSKDSDHPGHLPSLIKGFVVCMKKPWVLSNPLSTQQRLWSDWADVQADLSLLCEPRSSCGFVMLKLLYHRPLDLSLISHLKWHLYFGKANEVSIGKIERITLEIVLNFNTSTRYMYQLNSFKFSILDHPISIFNTFSFFKFHYWDLI